MAENANELHAFPAICCACRHLRKRCDETCVLAPLFPLEREQEFQIVHRIFGVQNVTRIINAVEEKDRERTAETLILEAQMRLHNPVHGSLAVERMLRAELDQVAKELDAVRQQLHLFRGGGEGPSNQGAAPLPDEEGNRPPTPQRVDGSGKRPM